MTTATAFMSTTTTRREVLDITSSLLEKVDNAQAELRKATTGMGPDLHSVVTKLSSETQQDVALIRAMDEMAQIAQSAITITVDLFLAIDRIEAFLKRWEEDKRRFNIVVGA